MPEIALPPEPKPAPPAPTPSPAPTPPPTPTPAPPKGEDPFADLDSQYATEAKAAMEAPTTAPTAPQAPAKASEQPKAPVTAKPAVEAVKPVQTAPKQLREELERTKTELKTKTDSLTDLQAKITDYEVRGKDTAALAERATKLEQQIAQLEQDNRMLRHEVSPEFKKQYDDRFEQAADEARQEVQTLPAGSKKVDPATGEAAWQSDRLANWDRDFGSLYPLPYIEAKARAKEVFGEEWERVMTHYNELHKIQRERERALKTERDTWQTKEKERQAESARQREAFNASWQKVNQDLQERVEDYRDIDPADKEVVDARQKGYQIFDAQPQTFQQKIVKDAHIRHRVAAFGPHEDQMKRAKRRTGCTQRIHEGAGIRATGKDTKTSQLRSTATGRRLGNSGETGTQLGSVSGECLASGWYPIVTQHGFVTLIKLFPLFHRSAVHRALIWRQ